MEGLINPVIVNNNYIKWLKDKGLNTEPMIELEYKYAQSQKKYPSDDVFLILRSIDLMSSGSCEYDWQLARIACFSLSGIPTIPTAVSAPDVLSIAMFLNLDFSGRWDHNRHETEVQPAGENNSSENGLQTAVKDFLYAACLYHGHTILPTCMWLLYPENYSELTKNTSNWYLREIADKNNNIDKVIRNFNGGRE